MNTHYFAASVFQLAICFSRERKFTYECLRRPLSYTVPHTHARELPEFLGTMHINARASDEDAAPPTPSADESVVGGTAAAAQQQRRHGSSADELYRQGPQPWGSDVVGPGLMRSGRPAGDVGSESKRLPPGPPSLSSAARQPALRARAAAAGVR